MATSDWPPPNFPLVPGDVLVQTGGSKGLLLCIGSGEEGAYLMWTARRGVRFQLESWANVRSSWQMGQTRKLSTFL